MIKVQYDNTTKRVVDIVSGKLSSLPQRDNCTIVNLNRSMLGKDAQGYTYNESKKKLIENQSFMAQTQEDIIIDNLIEDKKILLVGDLAKQELIDEGTLNSDGTLK